jgi:hypothetical protein
MNRLNEAAPHLDAALATAQKHGRALLLLQGERLYARLLEAIDLPPKLSFARQ